uniref:Drosha n=1 Tax=Creolimax fragrantissima TaxID=470921 RepID=A0A383QTL2_CREFR|nr:Drosha [Creolimax fragrantissima]|eukprot:CFRG0685T1
MDFCACESFREACVNRHGIAPRPEMERQLRDRPLDFTVRDCGWDFRFDCLRNYPTTTIPSQNNTNTTTNTHTNANTGENSGTTDSVDRKHESVVNDVSRLPCGCHPTDNSANTHLSCYRLTPSPLNTPIAPTDHTVISGPGNRIYGFRGLYIMTHNPVQPDSDGSTRVCSINRDRFRASDNVEEGISGNIDENANGDKKVDALGEYDKGEDAIPGVSESVSENVGRNTSSSTDQDASFDTEVNGFSMEGMWTGQLTKCLLPLELFDIPILNVIGDYIFYQILQLVDWWVPGDMPAIHVLPIFEATEGNGPPVLLHANDLLTALKNMCMPVPKLMNMSNSWRSFETSIVGTIVRSSNSPAVRVDQIRNDKPNKLKTMKGVRLMHFVSRCTQDQLNFQYDIWTPPQKVMRNNGAVTQALSTLKRQRREYASDRGAVPLSLFLPIAETTTTGIRADVCELALAIPSLYRQIELIRNACLLRSQLGLHTVPIKKLKSAMIHPSAREIFECGTTPRHIYNAVSHLGLRRKSNGTSTDNAAKRKPTKKRTYTSVCKDESANVDLSTGESGSGNIGVDASCANDRKQRKKTTTTSVDVHVASSPTSAYTVSYISDVITNRVICDSDSARMTSLGIVSLIVRPPVGYWTSAPLQEAILADTLLALIDVLFDSGGVEFCARSYAKWAFPSPDEDDLVQMFISPPQHPLVSSAPMMSTGNELARAVESNFDFSFDNPNLLEVVLGHSSSLFERSTGMHKSYSVDMCEDLQTHTHARARVTSNVSNSFSQLEFLGDAVLGMMVSGYVQTQYAHLSSKGVVALCDIVVSNDHLSSVMSSLKMTSYVVGNENLIRKRNVLANTFEALVGAVFLDKGLTAVAIFLEEHLYSTLTRSRILQRGHPSHPHNDKTWLLMYCLTQSKYNGSTPVYRFQRNASDPLRKTNIAMEPTVEVSASGIVLATASATNRKDAEMLAATQAMCTLAMGNQV